jgi:hypothetical protein
MYFIELLLPSDFLQNIQDIQYQLLIWNNRSKKLINIKIKGNLMKQLQTKLFFPVSYRIIQIVANYKRQHQKIAALLKIYDMFEKNKVISITEDAVESIENAFETIIINPPDTFTS